MKKNLVSLVILLIAVPFFGSSQDSTAFELSYEVNRIYPAFSISKEKLAEANTLLDLNIHYKPSWIKEYRSVEISALNDGKLRSVISENETLSQQQKDIMNRVDPGTDISIVISYIPDNTLRHNDIKKMDFAFVVEPENQASYPGGQELLKRYIEEKVIDQIALDQFKRYQLTAVKFNIDEIGQVVDTHIFWSSEDEKLDKLLLTTIDQMPIWKPAEYANGLNVNQEFVLMIGDKQSCVINLLNIRQGGLAKNQ